MVEQHYQPLFRFAAALCGRPDTALELTQRTFHRALERGITPPARSNVKQWLFTMLFLEFLEIRPRAGNSPKSAIFS